MRQTIEKQVVKTFGVVEEIVNHLVDIRKYDNPFCLLVCAKRDDYEFFNKQEYNKPDGKAYVQVLFAYDLKHVQTVTCGRQYSNIFFIGDVDKDIEKFILSRHRRPGYTGPKTVTWFDDSEL